MTENDERPTCPKCGAEINAIVSTGPGEHRVEPCGHLIPSGHELLDDG